MYCKDVTQSKWNFLSHFILVHYIILCAAYGKILHSTQHNGIYFSTQMHIQFLSQCWQEYYFLLHAPLYSDILSNILILGILVKFWVPLFYCSVEKFINIDTLYASNGCLFVKQHVYTITWFPTEQKYGFINIFCWLGNFGFLVQLTDKNT